MKGLAKPLLAVAIYAAATAPALTQSSPSYRLTEQVFNAGGRPADGIFLSSPSYALGLESIGEPIAGHALAGASYQLDSGLPAGYAPPGEVEGVQFLDDSQTLVWAWEPSSMVFNLYAGTMSTFPGGYGLCADPHVTDASWDGAGMPDPGTAIFYLVTGVNRIDQEGTKGFTSSGAERGNPSPCP